MTKTDTKRFANAAVKAAEAATELDRILHQQLYHGLHIRLVREAIPVLRDIVEEARTASREAGLDAS